MEFATEKELTGEAIKLLRQKLNMTQKEFALFVNVSQKTIERWESGVSMVSGPITVLYKILKEHLNLKETLEIPPQEYPLRLKYYYYDDLCTIIDIDERNQQIKIKNFVTDYIYRAFGRNEHPTMEDYRYFLESRCFPKTRDKMKWMLKELDLPFYDPFLIIEKTEGRMAEDHFHIQIERRFSND